MDFKTAAFVTCFLSLSVQVALALPVGKNDSYACLGASECGSDSLYAVIGNLTLCCNDGDAITFTAKSDNFFYSKSVYVQSSENVTDTGNHTITKRSAGSPPGNNTIAYGCVCSQVSDQQGAEDIGYAITYLRIQMMKSKQFVQSLLDSLVSY